jgi:hypothetical protein
MLFVDNQSSLGVVHVVVSTLALCLILTLSVNIDESIRTVASLFALQWQHIVFVALVSASELRDVTARLVHIASLALDRTEVL